MSNLLITMPSWLNITIDWTLVCTVIINLIGIVAALIKLRSAGKQNAANSTAQINVLGMIADKLSDTRTLSENISVIVDVMKEYWSMFESSITIQRESNAKLAAFIMECFNMSNLSDENKAKLQVMCNKIFYDNNEEIIEALKNGKLALEQALLENKTRIEELEKALADKTEQLAKAQENVKENRRI